MSRQIVVALDGSDLAESVLAHAIAFARSLDASIVLVRVHTPIMDRFDPSMLPVMPFSPEAEHEIQEAARHWLDKRAARLESQAQLPVAADFRIGLAADEIVSAARDHDAAAIVCTTHGSGGWAPEWIGSVCDAVIRRATCPVLALGKDATERRVGIHSILVPLDGTASDDAALPEAASLAHALHAKVELFRVVAPAWLGDLLLLQPVEKRDKFGIDTLAAHTKTTLDATAARLRTEGVETSATVGVDGNVIRALLARIRESDPDLVVVSTGGRGLSRLVLPSISDRVLRSSHRATLFVHEQRGPRRPWRDVIVAATAAWAT